jgi:polysaccharide export outer membrane protein
MKNFILLTLALLATAGAACAQSVLRAGDTIDVKLGGVDPTEMAAFGGTYTIDEGGTINLPYIGPVQAAGLPSAQLQTTIEKKLIDGKIYTHPTITVNIPQGLRFVNVGGSVRAPGRIMYTPDLTVTSAVNAAGGFNDYADQNRIRWIHEGKTVKVSAKAVRKDPSKDPKVYPGDQIEVPQSWF